MVGIGTLFRAKASDQELRERMTQLPGIGEWTLESRSKVEAKQTWQVHKQTQESERDQYFTKETWDGRTENKQWHGISMNLPIPSWILNFWRCSEGVRSGDVPDFPTASPWRLPVTGPRGMPWTYLVHLSAPLQSLHWMEGFNVNANCYEHQWISMNINEYQWTSMNINEH